jgi:hypothetical protein
VTVWVPTETRFAGEHLPAWTANGVPPSMRNVNVGCDAGRASVGGAGKRTAALQTSSRPRAVLVIVAVFTPAAMVRPTGPFWSMYWPDSS